MNQSPDSDARPPLKSIAGVLLVAISLSIGWGIRGNFGHESGAMIPGALAALACVLLSGREDWRTRVPYFALFGGLGWGFGGSIAYMYTVSFTMSGHLPTTAYGFGAMFLVGGLWCGLGGMGTALPALLDRQKLADLIVPLCFVLFAMYLKRWTIGPVAEFLNVENKEDILGTWTRHESPLYWFDADWYSASLAVIGVCLFDLWDRRFAKAYWLPVAAAVGAAAGWLVQKLLDITGLTSRLVSALVVQLGDPDAINPETQEPFGNENFLNNWPQFFGDFPEHLGWGLGLIAGLAVYFYLFGQFRRGSKLFLYMSLGWLTSFLLMPVLGTILLNDYGGFRLTPPRSDDWAGIFGVFVATSIYGVRHGLPRLSKAGAISFCLGGLSFATAQVVRAMLILPGHKWLNGGTVPPEWQHYQSANWHSFMEQSHGFGFGIAIAVMMIWLYRRATPPGDAPATSRWPEIFSITFVLFAMTHMNLFKNVREWTDPGKNPLVPERMKAPLIAAIELPAMVWFNFAWMAMTVVAVALMFRHTRRRIELVPATWLGKGQQIYILLLWMMVVGNFERALPLFRENRLITEWVIIINACLATLLVAALPRPSGALPVPSGRESSLAVLWGGGVVAGAIFMAAYTGLFFTIYGETTISHPDHAHRRFGDKASWRIKPNLKNSEHR